MGGRRYALAMLQRTLTSLAVAVLLSACGGGGDTYCSERPLCPGSRGFNERECRDDLRVLRTGAAGRCDRQLRDYEVCLGSLTCSDTPVETCGSSRAALGTCLGGA
jgi:hypothetical protein